MAPIIFMLRTVFMATDTNDFGYLKATVRSEDVTQMLKMGWSLTQTELVEAAAAAEKAEKLAMRGASEVPTDPKVGDGVLGSEDWHRNALAGMESKDDIQAYAAEQGAEIDKRGTIDTVREKALTAIMGPDNGNG